MFWLYLFLLLLLELLNILGGNRKPFAEILERQLDLSPALPMGQTGVIKSQILRFLLFFVSLLVLQVFNVL